MGRGEEGEVDTSVLLLINTSVLPINTIVRTIVRKGKRLSGKSWFRECLQRLIDYSIGAGAWHSVDDVSAFSEKLDRSLLLEECATPLPGCIGLYSPSTQVNLMEEACNQRHKVFLQTSIGSNFSLPFLVLVMI